MEIISSEGIGDTPSFGWLEIVLKWLETHTHKGFWKECPLW